MTQTKPTTPDFCELTGRRLLIQTVATDETLEIAEAPSGKIASFLLTEEQTSALVASIRDLATITPKALEIASNGAITVTIGQLAPSYVAAIMAGLEVKITLSAEETRAFIEEYQRRETPPLASMSWNRDKDGKVIPYPGQAEAEEEGRRVHRIQ